MDLSELSCFKMIPQHLIQKEREILRKERNALEEIEKNRRFAIKVQKGFARATNMDRHESKMAMLNIASHAFNDEINIKKHTLEEIHKLRKEYEEWKTRQNDH